MRAHVFWTVVGVVLAAACNRTEDGARQERTDLAREQAQERSDLAQEQAEERREARGQAQDDLAEATQEVKEERTELASERRVLQAIADRACRGLPGPSTTQCPLQTGWVSRVKDTDEGVAFTMKKEAGEERDLEQRVACYQAHLELSSTAPAGGSTPPAGTTKAASASSCLLDLPELEVDVDDDNGRVLVELETDNETRRRELRDRARTMTAARSMGAE